MSRPPYGVTSGSWLCSVHCLSGAPVNHTTCERSPEQRFSQNTRVSKNTGGRGREDQGAFHVYVCVYMMDYHTGCLRLTRLWNDCRARDDGAGSTRGSVSSVNTVSL